MRSSLGLFARIDRPTNMASTLYMHSTTTKYRRRPTCSRSARTYKRWNYLSQCRNRPVISANQHTMGKSAREVRSQPLSWQRHIYYIALHILERPMLPSQAFLC